MDIERVMCCELFVYYDWIMIIIELKKLVIFCVGLWWLRESEFNLKLNWIGDVRLCWNVVIVKNVKKWFYKN